MEEQSTELSIFRFEDHPLRAKMINGEPWFVGKDICQMLSIVNVSQAIGKLDEDEKGIYSIDTPGGLQLTLFVSLPGLQKLIFRSDKPEANRITRWVTHEVLPEIYKTGSYTVPGVQIPLAVSFDMSGLDRLIIQTEQRVKRNQRALEHLKQARALLVGSEQEAGAGNNAKQLASPSKVAPQVEPGERILQCLLKHGSKFPDGMTRRDVERYLKSLSADSIRAHIALLTERGVLIRVQTETGRSWRYRISQ